MSKYRIPSSHHLIAFEAAARLKSFSLAADELCLSPPAITNRVKQLESYLDRQLFMRLPKGIVLTDAGASFYQDIEKSLNLLQKSIDSHKGKVSWKLVSVSVTPTFANRWLVKRLKHFWSAYPEIELKIRHSLENIALSAEQINIAVRWGNGQWSGLVSKRLFSGDKYPIISPVLAEKINLKSPLDFGKTTLLHEDNYNDWEKWFEISGHAYGSGRLGPIIDDAEALLQLTIDGQGVALGRIAMLEEELNKKQLICPFDISLPSENGYWLVYPPSLEDNTEVMCFRDFLLEQAQQTVSQ